MNIHLSMSILTKKCFSIRRLGSVSVCTEHFKKFSDFIILCPSWSFFLLVLVPSVGFSSIIVSGGFSVSRGMRLWETDLPNLLIFDDAFAWTFSICARSKKAIWACRRSSCDSRVELGQSSTSAYYSRFPEACQQTSEFCKTMYSRVLLLVLSRLKLSLRTIIVSIFFDNFYNAFYW